MYSFESHGTAAFPRFDVFCRRIQEHSYEASFAEDITADQFRAPLPRFKMDDLFGDLPPPCNTTKSSDPLITLLLLAESHHFGLCYFLSASADDLLGNLYDDLPTSENTGENKRKLETLTDPEDNELPAKRILAGEEIILLILGIY